MNRHRQWFAEHPKLRDTLIVAVAMMIGCIVWQLTIEVELLPRWASYLGGPVVGLTGAWWLYPRIR